MQKPSMKGLSIQFRESMQKFQASHKILDWKLCIVQHSKPTKFGYLNLQLILLFSTLGIPEEIFVQKCTDYLNSIQNITSDAFFAWKWLLMKGEQRMAQKIEKSIINSARVTLPMKELFKIQDAEKMELQRLDSSSSKTFFETLPTKDRLRIPVIQSRIVFGVCDISEKLVYGECFFQPTICGAPTILRDRHVVVSRNPCYHPGDVRVLKVVDIPECHHLIDCIVFPVNGKRPHADEMSGGDLDGDEFFVCWDPELIPKETEEPASYQKPAKKEIIDQSIALHMEEIRQQREFAVTSARKELGDMFSMAIDFAPTNFARLQQLQQEANALCLQKPTFWQILLEKINQLCQDKYNENDNLPSSRSSFIKSFLEDTQIRWLMSETAYAELYTKLSSQKHVPEQPTVASFVACSFHCTKLDCTGNHPSTSDSIDIMLQLAANARRHLNEKLVSCKSIMEEEYGPKKILEENIVGLNNIKNSACNDKTGLENSLESIRNDLQKLLQEIKATEDQIQSVQEEKQLLNSFQVKLGRFWNNLWNKENSNTEHNAQLQALEEKLQERKEHLKHLLETKKHTLAYQAKIEGKHQDAVEILKQTLKRLKEQEYKDRNFDLTEWRRAREQYLEQWRIEQQFEANVKTYIDRLSNHAGDRQSFLADIQQPFLRELQQLNPEPEQDHPLPIYQWKNQIIEMVRNHSAVVIAAETGSGKTTQIVQYLADAGFAKDRKPIVCTQPRRIAAREMCSRVQKQFGEDLVNFIIGGMALQQNKRKQFQQPTITFVTTGVLLAQSQADPYFNKYSVVIVDEAHERSLEIDLLLGLLKRAIQHRSDLKVVITSASINTEKFRTYFSCPFKEIPGKLYPVQEIYRPLKLQEEYTIVAAELAFKIHHTKPAGHILIFLPGKSCISKTCEWLNQKLHDQFDPKARKELEEQLGFGISNALYLVVPLHSCLSVEEQSIAVDPTIKRKIIVSTNVAETSITIKDVAYVIDSGFFKEKSHKGGFGSFLVQEISRASAKQRMGRAGRTCPGECHRLYSEEKFKSMPEYHPPQILRVPFAGTLLMLKNRELENLEFMDPVPKEEILHAQRLLTGLGALDAKGNLTPVGKQMCMIPAEPRVAKMILEGQRLKCLSDILTIASMLSVHDSIFVQTDPRELSDEKKAKFVHESGDHLTLLNVYNDWIKQEPKHRKKWSRNNLINSEIIVNEANLLRRKLEACLPGIGIENQFYPSNQDAICEAICRAFCANACSPNDKLTTKAGFTVIEAQIMALLHPSSALNWSADLVTGTWLVCHEHLTTNQATYLKTVTRIKEEWLPVTMMKPPIYKLTVNIGPLVRRALCSGKPALIQKIQQETVTIIGILDFQLSVWSLNKAGAKAAGHRIVELQHEMANIPHERELTIETQHSIHSVRVKVQGALALTSVIRHQNQSTRVKIFGLSGHNSMSEVTKLESECKKRGANFYRTGFGYLVADFPTQQAADKAIFDLDGNAFLQTSIMMVESNPNALCVGAIQPTRQYSYKLFIPSHLQEKAEYDIICRKLREHDSRFRITVMTKKCNLIIFRTPTPVCMPTLLGYGIRQDTGVTALIPRKLMECQQFEMQLKLKLPKFRALPGNQFFRIIIDCDASDETKIITHLKQLLAVTKIRLDPIVDMKEYKDLCKEWNEIEDVYVQLLAKEHIVAIAGLEDAKPGCVKQILRDINRLVQKYKTLEIPLPLDFALELQQDPIASRIPIDWKSNKIILKGDNIQHEHYILSKIWTMRQATPDLSFKLCCRCQANSKICNLNICGHPYCQDCLKRQLTEAMKDQSFRVHCKLCNNPYVIDDLKALTAHTADVFLACAVQSTVTL